MINPAYAGGCRAHKMYFNEEQWKECDAKEGAQEREKHEQEGASCVTLALSRSHPGELPSNE